MTTEVNTHIGLEDIAAIRLSCTDCGASSQIPLNSDQFTRFATAMFRCPHCNAQWFESQNDRRYVDVRAFLEYLKDASAIVMQLEGSGVPLRLSLQIKGELVYRASGGKD